MTHPTPRRPVALIVLDGFGLAPDGPGNAVATARTPTFDRLWQDAPHTTLEASGRAVGLPDGQMGNSEVGHTNLGAGRVVQQSLGFIQDRIDDGRFADDPTLAAAFDAAARSGGAVHLLGLASRGGVHSDLRHLFGLLDLADRRADVPVRVHAFTDGRDTGPHSGRGFLGEVQARVDAASADVRITSVTGRYYAMDRDHRWERTRAAFDAVVCGHGTHTAASADAAVEAAYARGESDEFLAPTVLVDDGGTPIGPIADGDAVVWFNFRADRARQLVEALTADAAWDAFERCRTPRVHVTSLMEIDPTFGLPYAFELPPLRDGLTEVMSKAGFTQYHAAETEKYPHVTYFFNAQLETPFEGEDREIVPSPDVATYDLRPEMSAASLTDAVVARLEARDDAFVLVNYANPDMVGHTGDLAAAITACETVDAELGRLLDAVLAKDGAAVILADHGNAERMIDDDGGPHTAHTTNPVPCVVVGAGPVPLRGGGVLGDVAPTVLELLGLEAPAEMTGRSLLEEVAPA